MILAVISFTFSSRGLCDGLGDGLYLLIGVGLLISHYLTCQPVLSAIPLS